MSQGEHDLYKKVRGLSAMLALGIGFLTLGGIYANWQIQQSLIHQVSIEVKEIKVSVESLRNEVIEIKTVQRIIEDREGR